VAIALKQKGNYVAEPRSFSLFRGPHPSHDAEFYFLGPGIDMPSMPGFVSNGKQ